MPMRGIVRRVPRDVQIVVEASNLAVGGSFGGWTVIVDNVERRVNDAPGQGNHEQVTQPHGRKLKRRREPGEVARLGLAFTPRLRTPYDRVIA